MSQIAKKAIHRLLGIEGDYSNHPGDPGGQTRFGITKQVARDNGYSGEMQEMPLSVAEEIYFRKYWHPLRLNSISTISPDLSYELFEYGVNSGITRSAKALQIILNVFNKDEDYYPDLAEDGIIGPVTIGALRSFVEIREKQGLNTLIKAFNCLQGAFYIELARSNKNFETFVYGWIIHRIEHNYNFEW